MIRKLALLVSAIGLAAVAQAQDQSEPPEVVGGSVRSAQTIAVPAMPAAQGASEALGRQIAEVISSDLRSTGAFTPLGPNGIGSYTVAQAGSPAYGEWRGAGASALVSGYVEARPDGRVTLACLLHDVTAGRQLASQGFTVAAADWRRAAHKCADTVYARLTGEGAYLDTRIVYVAESGPKTNRVKRIALMDSDGSNLRYLTAGRSNVTTPRFSPSGNQLVYTGTLARKPRVFVIDVATGVERLLVPGGAITFAPRFSPCAQEKTIRRPSGEKLGEVSAPGALVRRVGTPPFAPTMKMSVLPPCAQLNTIWRPSGEKRGAKVIAPPGTSSRSAPLAMSTTNTRGLRASTPV